MERGKPGRTANTHDLPRESANYAVLETMNGLLKWKNHTDASSRHAGFQRKGPAEPGMEGRGPSLQDNLPGRQPPKKQGNQTHEELQALQS